MPEGPEVTFLARYRLQALVGSNLTSIDIRKGRYQRHGPPAGMYSLESELPLKILSIKKRGKVIFWELASGWHMISKLGMTGWWYVDDHDPLPDVSKYNIVLKIGTHEVVFVDPRNFGTLTLYNVNDNSQKSLLDKEWKQLAPDIMEPLSEEEFIGRWQSRYSSAAKKKHLVEDALMDQKELISGIGNYLKSEALYAARIHPKKQMGTFTEEQKQELFRALVQVSHGSLKYMIAHPLGYMEYDNDPFLKVYQRNEDPEGRKVVTHTTKHGRTTFWVPEVQIM